MFVSPPPASVTPQFLQKRHSKKNISNTDITSHNIYDEHSQSIYSNHQDHSDYSINQNESQVGTSGQNPLEARSNFVSAPVEYTDRARVEIKRRLANHHPHHHNVPKINPKNIVSNNELTSIKSHRTIDDNSVFSDNASSYQSSIFSHPSTVITQNTSDSISNATPKFVTRVTLEEALPKTFYDMYAPEVLMGGPSKVLYNGRPSFTKRELLDWDLNDIRSLLIVDQLKPEWGNHLPEVVTTRPNLPKFRLQLLPLRSIDSLIISTLVNSDLYLEANLDYEFKLTSAKYTVASARQRHEQITGLNEPVMNLSKPEWRNIIENYLLNIAVEAQCRFDFKQRCSEYRKWKIQQSNLKRPDMPPPSLIPLSQNQSAPSHNNLLKKTLMKNLQLKTNGGLEPIPEFGAQDKQNVKISLNKEEKANIWSHCQAQVYQRLGLDWQPDGVR